MTSQYPRFKSERAARNSPKSEARNSAQSPLSSSIYPSGGISPYPHEYVTGVPYSSDAVNPHAPPSEAKKSLWKQLAPRNEMIFNKVIPPLKIVSAALGINLKFSFITSFPLVSHIIPNLMYMLYADLAYQKYDISYRFFNIPAGTPPTTV